MFLSRQESFQEVEIVPKAFIQVVIKDHREPNRFFLVGLRLSLCLLWVFLSDILSSSLVLLGAGFILEEDKDSMDESKTNLKYLGTYVLYQMSEKRTTI